MSKKSDKPADNAAAKTEEQSAPKSRRVMLFGRLENEVAMPVIKRLLRLNDRDPHTPIDLLINSSGGNGYNADAIIAVMNQIQAPVNTVCLGHALSGACEILASGTGQRSAYEFSTLMFHQTLWEADGDITNLEIQAAQGKKFREAQIELLYRCTGQDKKRLRTDIERDFYLSAEEGLAYGLIDEIIFHSAAQKRSAAKIGRKAAKAAPVKAGKPEAGGKSQRTGQKGK
ncbi:MAG: ATP-dependent Clp protease proteolytic subunit [Candidatus Obscuribacterales bacterium]|nr:ATP-dependent Clp protease proteolytic subunit [Candidatus Obscuribacterales bacterium]